MMKTITAADLLRMEQILDSGIPLDEGVVANLRTSCLGLSVYQTGSPLENELFDLEFSGFGLIVSVAVCNDTPKPIRVGQYRFEPPWPVLGFRWLEDPWKKVPREDSYSFPRYGPEGMDRDWVLNHRIGRHGALFPGDHMEGVLCGTGQSCLPDIYRHRQHLPLQLSVFDGRGNETCLIVNMLVSRKKANQKVANIIKTSAIRECR